MTRLAILISGRGSNMHALLDACAAPLYPADAAVVISDRADAAGLSFARKCGVETLVVERGAYGSREAFDGALDDAIRRRRVDLVCLAGFMRLLGSAFTARWRDRLVNIHPSLLPAFRGLNTHARALAAGVRFAGCTVHFVREEMDTGPIIAQAAVPVRADDDEEDLALRVLEQEHGIYQDAVRWIAEGRVRVVGERALVDGGEAPWDALVNPVE